ncbi:MAG: lipoate--protein ligase family protein, partial [Bacteroidales bacterium]|nr:lipoate--protein ligase family protein [Bacteroidales bacterium]
MKIINHKSIDSAFWFALEEYIMHSPKFEDEYFLLWRTAPTLMIGRFQNTLQEINSDFVRENNIQIVRRNSGGGTIYTDPSAWQFSFITWKNKGEAKDFQVFTKPVIDALKKLGVPAEFNNRNDILAAGKKFSGNAQFSTKDRFLHHGSILYDTNLDFLVKALHVDDEKFISKGIKSVRERVTNIRPFMAKDLTSKGFSIAMRDLLASEMQEHKLDSSDME